MFGVQNPVWQAELHGKRGNGGRMESPYKAWVLVCRIKSSHAPCFTYFYTILCTCQYINIYNMFIYMPCMVSESSFCAAAPATLGLSTFLACCLEKSQFFQNTYGLEECHPYYLHLHPSCYKSPHVHRQMPIACRCACRYVPCNRTTLCDLQHVITNI